jgi:hypothetical protein
LEEFGDVGFGHGMLSVYIFSIYQER